jgi:hypothetical protein
VLAAYWKSTEVYINQGLGQVMGENQGACKIRIQIGSLITQVVLIQTVENGQSSNTDKKQPFIEDKTAPGWKCLNLGAQMMLLYSIHHRLIYG